MAVGDAYYGVIDATIRSYAKSGDSYEFVVDFRFNCEAFSGAKTPIINITSSSGGSCTLIGQGSDNDPMTTRFLIQADAGDVIKVVSASWKDPMDSGSSVYINAPFDIYTIPTKAEKRGTTWGSIAWGGMFYNNWRELEGEIDGVVRIERTESDSINGATRISRQEKANISGATMIRKSVGKNIEGAVNILATMETSVSGAANIVSPITYVSSTDMSGLVCINADNDTNITGSVFIDVVSNVEIPGAVNIQKYQLADVSGQVNIVKTQNTSVTGAVRLRTTTPEKLPQKWENGEYAQPEGWEEDLKASESWFEEDKTTDNWENAEKDNTDWSYGEDAGPDTWEYPIEQNS